MISVIGAPETVEGTADTQASDYYKIDGTKYNLSASLNENPAEGDYSRHLHLLPGSDGQHCWFHRDRGRHLR